MKIVYSFTHSFCQYPIENAEFLVKAKKMLQFIIIYAIPMAWLW